MFFAAADETPGGLVSLTNPGMLLFACFASFAARVRLKKSTWLVDRRTHLGFLVARGRFSRGFQVTLQLLDLERHRGRRSAREQGESLSFCQQTLAEGPQIRMCRLLVKLKLHPTLTETESCLRIILTQLLLRTVESFQK